MLFLLHYPREVPVTYSDNEPNKHIITRPKFPCLNQYEDLIIKQIRFETLS